MDGIAFVKSAEIKRKNNELLWTSLLKKNKLIIRYA